MKTHQSGISECLRITDLYVSSLHFPAYVCDWRTAGVITPPDMQASPMHTFVTVLATQDTQTLPNSDQCVIELGRFSHAIGIAPALLLLAQRSLPLAKQILNFSDKTALKVVHQLTLMYTPVSVPGEYQHATIKVHFHDEYN